jgi:hypothetical protein
MDMDIDMDIDLQLEEDDRMEAEEVQKTQENMTVKKELQLMRVRPPTRTMEPIPSYPT